MRENRQNNFKTFNLLLNYTLYNYLQKICIENFKFKLLDLFVLYDNK